MIVRVVLLHVTVQCKIQCQHVHPGFSKNPKLTFFRMLYHKPPNDCIIKSPRSGNPADLVLGRSRTDMRVQPTARSGDQIHRNGERIVGVGGLERIDASLHGFHQRVIGRA